LIEAGVYFFDSLDDPTRKVRMRAEYDGAEQVYYGAHGGIKKFCKMTPEEEHAAKLTVLFVQRIFRERFVLRFLS
jgi:hypothetical protein